LREIERERERALRACFMLAKVHMPTSLVIERERERERDREREREREREKERKRERERDRVRKRERGRERERERCRKCPELLFLFLKGMTGALSPFSYLVYIECSLGVSSHFGC
jgi:hypothetical protein